MGDSGVGVIEEESEVFLVRNKKEKGGKFQPKHKQTHSPRSSRCTEAPAPVSWAVPCAQHPSSLWILVPPLRGRAASPQVPDSTQSDSGTAPRTFSAQEAPGSHSPNQSTDTPNHDRRHPPSWQKGPASWRAEETWRLRARWPYCSGWGAAASPPWRLRRLAAPWAGQPWGSFPESHTSGRPRSWGSRDPGRGRCSQNAWG